MKIEQFFIKITAFMVICLAFCGCPQKMVHPNIRPDKQKEQYKTAYDECFAWAYGQIPAKQIHLNSKGDSSSIGTFSGNDNQGTTYSGTYNTQTQYNDPAANIVDIANLTSSLASTLARAKAIEQCMKSKGWREQSQGQASFWRILNEKKPGWIDIENDQDFQIWLQDNIKVVDYSDAVRGYDHEFVISIMDEWENEVRDINDVLKTDLFHKWLQDQPEYFKTVATSGRPHQKKALYEHYKTVVMREGVCDIPYDFLFKDIGIWSAGMQALNEKKNREAFYYFGGLAAWGRIPLYYDLASLALDNLGLNDRAFLWDIKSAEEGFPNSQYYVGAAYFYGGRMVEKNYNFAFKYLFDSAEQGYPQAQQLIGLIYYFDRNRHSPKKIFYYSMLSALQGNPEGQSLYAACYGEGIFTPKSYYNAYKWYCIAKANGAQNIKEVINAVERMLSNQETSEAQEEASRYIKIHREKNFGQGFVVAMHKSFSESIHISYTLINPDQYLEIMNAIHDDISYELVATVKTDRVERLYRDIKDYLYEFKTDPAIYNIDNEKLKQVLEKSLDSSEKVIYY
ncbi:hypothetical protein JCM14469_26770 [Desulfatiferula olefinivorans]